MITTPNHHLQIPQADDLESDYPSDAAQSLGSLDNAAYFMVGTWANMPAASAVDPGTRYWVSDRSIEMVNSATQWVWPGASAVPVGTTTTTVLSAAPTDPDGQQRWMLAQGQSLSTSEYPVLNSLLSAAGYPFGSGSGTFNLPDTRGRSLVGAGQGSGLTSRTLGATGGEESHTLAISETPSHNHALTDPGHGHTVNDPGHAHGVADPGHAHSVYDPGHVHGYGYYPGGVYVVNQTAYKNGVGPYNFIGAGSGGAYNSGDTTTGSGTGIGIYGATTGIGIYGADTGVTNQTNTTGITLAAIGGSGAHNNMQPFLGLNVIIKVQ